ncbi:MAG: hypothetical protein QJR00_03795, partial [Bacillota bacterium]|nr:hypothetical protein [Bacillota bacterium]
SEVYGHPLDALFFLAVVLPTWDRRDAEEITGLEISTALWERFLALPFVRNRGPRRYLAPEVRRPLLAFLEREKPWLTFAWRKRTLRFWEKAPNRPHLWQGEQGEKESLLANPPAISLQEGIAQVKTFLEGCRRGKNLDAHLLAEVFGTIYPHLPRGRAKTWVQNALEDAPFFREKPILKDILWHYYFRPRKSHEELAHRFHLSRATYFRYHRDALERLARVLLPVEDSF